MTKRFTDLLAAVAIASLVATSAAQAATFTYNFTMNGASENLPNASPGTGTGTAVYNDVAHTLTLSASFSGLQGATTQSHFHALTATSGLPDNNPPGETANAAAAAVTNVGVAVGAGSLLNFPIGVTSGTYNQVIDMTLAGTYTGAWVTANGGTVAGAESGFFAALNAGRTYWNIHSQSFTGGEIRGFPVLVPEPATFAMAGAMMLGLIAAHRRRK